MSRVPLVLAATLACGCASTPAVPAAIPDTSSNAPARIETTTCALELVTEPGASTARPTRVALVLEGRGGFHVNLEYPLRVELGGSRSARFAQVGLGPADAAELDASRARFTTRVRWRVAGLQWLTVRVRFATCTADACVPQEHVLATRVHVR